MYKCIYFYLILILIKFNKLAFSQALSLGINNAKKKKSKLIATENTQKLLISW
jgi:hypothetical protein